MTIIGETRQTDYAIGVSDHPCGEIAPEMQAVMDQNSQALAEMMASKRAIQVYAVGSLTPIELRTPASSYPPRESTDEERQ